MPPHHKQREHPCSLQLESLCSEGRPSTAKNNFLKKEISYQCHLALLQVLCVGQGNVPSPQSRVLAFHRSGHQRASFVHLSDKYATVPGKQGSFTPSAISDPSAFKSISSCQEQQQQLTLSRGEKHWHIHLWPLTPMRGCPFTLSGALGPQDESSEQL